MASVLAHPWLFTAAPLLAAARYTGVNYAAPYWVGVVLMIVAGVVVVKAHIVDASLST